MARSMGLPPHPHQFALAVKRDDLVDCRGWVDVVDRSRVTFSCWSTSLATRRPLADKWTWLLPRAVEWDQLSLGQGPDRHFWRGRQEHGDFETLRSDECNRACTGAFAFIKGHEQECGHKWKRHQFAQIDERLERPQEGLKVPLVTSLHRRLRGEIHSRRLGEVASHSSSDSFKILTSVHAEQIIDPDSERLDVTTAVGESVDDAGRERYVMACIVQRQVIVLQFGRPVLRKYIFETGAQEPADIAVAIGNGERGTRADGKIIGTDPAAASLAVEQRMIPRIPKAGSESRFPSVVALARKAVGTPPITPVVPLPELLLLANQSKSASAPMTKLPIW